MDIIAIEGSVRSTVYDWHPIDALFHFERFAPLSPDRAIEELSFSEVAPSVYDTLSNGRPAIVAIPGWSSTLAIAGLMWCCRHRVPAVLMSDSTAMDERRVWWKEWPKSRIVRLFSAALAGGERHVEYLDQLGMPRERIFHGYDVVDNDYFDSMAVRVRDEAEGHRQRLGLPKKYFLTSARFVHKKNLSRLIEAYARYRALLAKGTDGESSWHLVVLGDGELRDDVLAAIASHGVGGFVHLPGFKQYSDLPAYYALASVFVLPSTTEQWGLVVNEAMACGLPVLVSERCGCAPDLVREGENGFTFDPYDVQQLASLMKKMSSGACDVAAMGEASRRIIAQWSPQTFAENLSKAVEAALAAPKKRVGYFDRALLWALSRR